jgi:hypothetical protein
MPELSMYPLLLFIHVLSAIVLMGSTLSAPLARGLVLRARSAADLGASIALSRRAVKWNPLAAIVLLATGIYLGSWGWWSQPWFYVSIASWIVSTVLAVAVLQRAEEAIAALAGRAGDGPITAELDAMRQSRKWGLTHAAMFANDLAILFIMFVKPSLAGSIGLLIVANTLLVSAVLMRQRAAPPRAAKERTPVVSA